MKKEEADRLYLEEMEALKTSIREEQSRILTEYAGRVCPWHKGDQVITPNGVGTVVKGCIETVTGGLPLVGVVINFDDQQEPVACKLEDVKPIATPKKVRGVTKLTE